MFCLNADRPYFVCVLSVQCAILLPSLACAVHHVCCLCANYRAIPRCLLAKSPAPYVVRVRSIPCVACLYAERFCVLKCILTCLECSPFRMMSCVSFVTRVLCTILLVYSLECLAFSPIGSLCAVFSVSRLFIK